MVRVDLNCDMGESFGTWQLGDDSAILPFVTSINVACGFHAGDPSVMRATVLAAAAVGVHIGAHPSLPDLVGFGRREMAISAVEAYDLTVYQLGALQAVASVCGVRVQHVKPHGALYNMAAARDDLADSIARAVRDVDSALMLFGLSGSALISAGRACGLQTVSEVFADRAYRADGSLVPRASPNATISDPQLAAQRALNMVQHAQVAAEDGAPVSVTVDTICIHGDTPGAAAMANAIRSALRDAAVLVAPPSAQ